MAKNFWDDKINSTHASNPRGAAIDAKRQSADALADCPSLSTLDHTTQVQKLCDMVKQVFGDKPDYIIHRRSIGKKDPFTAIKISRDINRLIQNRLRSMRSEIDKINLSSRNPNKPKITRGISGTNANIWRVYSKR